MSSADAEVLELLRLQDTPELLTTTELVEKLRERNVGITARKLNYYQSEGLLPRSLRIGARAGAYPSKVLDLAEFVITSRAYGFSIETIKSLRPFWMKVQQMLHVGQLDLREVQRFADEVERPEERALFCDILNALRSCPRCQGRTVWVDVVIGLDGSVMQIDQAKGWNLYVGVHDEQDSVDPYRAIPMEVPEVDPNQLLVLGGRPTGDFHIWCSRRPASETIEEPQLVAT